MQNCLLLKDRWWGASGVLRTGIKAALSGLADSRWDLAAMADPCLEFAPAAIRAAEAKHEALEIEVLAMKDTAAASAVQTSNHAKILLDEGLALQVAASAGAVTSVGQSSLNLSVSEVLLVKLAALDGLSKAELWRGVTKDLLVIVSVAEQQMAGGKWILSAWTVPLLLEVYAKDIQAELLLTRDTQPTSEQAVVAARAAASTDAQASKARLRARLTNKPDASGRA
ncbi:MAG: hypothetical protein WDW38_001736 [Sanguina aurantia]